MIFFIPHFGIKGGAGKYIEHLSQQISSFDDVSFLGSYRHGYEDKSIKQSKLLNFSFKQLIIPCYSGVKRTTLIYYIFKLFILYIPLSLFSAKEKTKLSAANIIFFTSVIQLPLVLFLRASLNKTKFVLLVQENVILDGFIGKLCIHLLKKVDLIVSINKFSQNQLLKKSIDSILVVNNFKDIDDNYSNENIYDAIYVGGQIEIKGYYQVLELFETLSRRRDIKIAMLGDYNKQNRHRIKQLNKRASTDSYIHLIGNVACCNQYYAQSKFLLLPINSPHFCRPAIEVGLMKKTFIVTEFEGLADFSIPGFNCLTFEHGNLKSFIEAFEKMLDDSTRKCFEVNNNEFSLTFKSQHSIEKLIIELNI